MKTVTIRDSRKRCPETEKSLQLENEIVITRDGQPVAKLVRISAAAKKRSRWNVKEHARWLTLDEAQAVAAEALGREVVRPGRD